MAFLINNPNLPAAVAAKKATVAPLIKIQKGNMGQLFLVDRLHQYGGAFDVEQIPTPDPIFAGRYVRLDLGVKIESITIEGFSQVTSALTALPQTCWLDGTLDGTHLCLYTFETLSTVVAKVALNFTVPLATNNLHQISLPQGFTASSVVSDGLEFIGGSGEGRFSQQGINLTINSGSNFPLVVGNELVVTGNWLVTLPSPTCNVATFVLPNLNYLDYIDWMGISFSPTQNALSPQAKEFTWNEKTHCCNAFLDLPVAQVQPKLTNYESLLGSVTYNRPVR